MIRKKDISIHSEYDRGYVDGLANTYRPVGIDSAQYSEGYKSGVIDRPRVLNAVVVLRNVGLKDEASVLEGYLD